MKLHLQELVQIYGQQNLVSLVNQKGHEKPVKEAFEKYVQMVRISCIELIRRANSDLIRLTCPVSNTITLTFTMSARI